MRNVARALLLMSAAASGLCAQTAPTSGRVIRGFVYDSIAKAPLHNPVVQVMFLCSDAEHAVRLTGISDVDGRYEIVDVPDGAFMIGFFHPKLDSLGIEAPIRRVKVGEAGHAMDLSIPSPATIVTSAC